MKRKEADVLRGEIEHTRSSSCIRKKVVTQWRRYARVPSGIAAASVLFCGKGAMTKRAVGRVVHCDVVTAEIARRQQGKPNDGRDGLTPLTA